MEIKVEMKEAEKMEELIAEHERLMRALSENLERMEELRIRMSWKIEKTV